MPYKITEQLSESSMAGTELADFLRGNLVNLQGNKLTPMTSLIRENFIYEIETIAGFHCHQNKNRKPFNE